MATYFKDDHAKWQRKYKEPEMFCTKLKSPDIPLFIATTSNSVTLSNKRYGTIVTPVSTGVACTTKLGKKVLYEKIINKNNKHKKLFETTQQKINSFDKLYEKKLHANVIDLKNMTLFVIRYCKLLRKTKLIHFGSILKAKFFEKTIEADRLPCEKNSSVTLN